MKEEVKEDLSESEEKPKKRAIKWIIKEKVKTKAAAKKPLVYKANKWNPDIELIETNESLEGLSNDVDQSCCCVCSSREPIRAAETSNI